LLDYLIFAAGLALLLAGAELFVRATVRLSSSLGKSRLFLGMTLVAFGTSAPELAVGIFGVIDHSTDIGFGNIVGSNILNLLLVVGLTALIKPISVNPNIVKRDLPILFGLSIIFIIIGTGGKLTTPEAAVLGVMLIGYFIYLERLSKSENAIDLGKGNPAPTESIMSLPSLGNFGLVILAIGLLALGSHWTVQEALIIAESHGISEVTIGLTVVALGTSLPEIVTSLAAIRNREHDLALGNIIGSCMFNLIAIPAAMTLINFSAIPIDRHVILFDMPIMILAIIASFLLFYGKYKVTRGDGLLLLSFYLSYTILLLVKEQTESILDRPIVFIVLAASPMILAGLVKIAYRFFAGSEKKRLREV